MKQSKAIVCWTCEESDGNIFVAEDPYDADVENTHNVYRFWCERCFHEAHMDI